MNFFFQQEFFFKRFLKILKAKKTKDHTKQLSKGPNKILKQNVGNFLKILDWLI
jgi:hypothetical protein